MKTLRASIYLILVLFVAVMTVGCKKDRKPDIGPLSTSIRINEKDYPTVKIATQTWTAINYAGPGGIKFDPADSKPEYGKYYTFEEVKAVSLPEGWRIPTLDDYIRLAESQGVIFEQMRAVNPEAIKSLTSKTHWKNVPGNNLSGFNALPGGYSFNNSAPLDGDISEFWVADGKTMSIQEGANLASLRLGFYSNSNSPEYRFNVRFVKDN